MDGGLLVISIVGGILGPLFIAIFMTPLISDSEDKLLIVFTCMLTFCFVISAAILVPTNLYQTTEYHFYVIDYDYDMECKFYQLIEDSSKIRNYLDVEETYDDRVSRVALSIRVHDKDVIREARKELDFPTFTSRKDALKYLCDQKGEEYMFTFDGKCLKCGYE